MGLTRHYSQRGGRKTQNKLGITINSKSFLIPQNNHWIKRIGLVYAFIIFDYISTLTFCRAPCQEANIYARAFMASFGIPAGLTLFVLLTNLPIYMMLSLDSHIARFPSKLALTVEIVVDCILAWFLAGLHFGGGTSWFWPSSGVMRQLSGTMLYLATAFICFRPRRPH